MCVSLYIYSFGTCGGLAKEASAGTCVVADKGAAYITRNVDGFTRYYSNGAGDENIPHADAYTLSQVCPAHAGLSALLSTELTNKIGEEKVRFGINVSGDSFYSSQGRVDDNFHDFNQDLVTDFVCNKLPDAASMEMETFNLLNLAICSAKQVIHASAAAIVVANRHSADVADASTLNDLECQGGEAFLSALAVFEMQINKYFYIYLYYLSKPSIILNRIKIVIIILYN